MTAVVHEIRRYQAYCLECGWYFAELESEQASERHAREHDAEEHA